MRFVVPIILAIGLALAGCGGGEGAGNGGATEGGGTTVSTPVSTPASTPTPTPVIDRTTTVVISGQQFTCQQAIAADDTGCSDDFQEAFNTWGNNLEAYLASGQLGPLGADLRSDQNPNGLMRGQDVLASGLGACIVASQSSGVGDTAAQNRYIDWLLGSYPGQERTLFLPMWFEASRSLCPDAFAGDGGYESHDLRVE